MGSLAMKNDLVLSLASSPLFLLWRDVTEGGKDVKDVQEEEEEKNKTEEKGEV